MFVDDHTKKSNTANSNLDVNTQNFRSGFGETHNYNSGDDENFNSNTKLIKNSNTEGFSGTVEEKTTK